MSTWKNVGMTYLKYADLCATHLRNSLKEPAKTKAAALGNMHARVMQWEAGKRGIPSACRPGALGHCTQMPKTCPALSFNTYTMLAMACHPYNLRLRSC